MSRIKTKFLEANAVTNAKLAQMAQSTIKGRAAAAGTGDPTDLSAAQVNTILGISGTNTGDVTLTAVGASPNSNAASLSGQALTIQPADATNPGVITSGIQSIGGNKTFTGNIATSGEITVGTYINTNTGLANPAYSEGRVFYDNTEKTLAYYNESSTVTLNIGQEEYIRVLNSTGSTLASGVPVYINGANVSGVPTVALGNANALATSPVAGVTTQSILNGAFGYVTAFGKVHDVNTSAFAAGSILYLSTTAGTYTTTRPAHPNSSVVVGYVVTQNAVTGIIFVSPKTVGGDAVGTRSNSFNIGDTLAGTKTLVFSTNTPGTIAWAPTATHTLTLPATQGAASTVLTNNGSGVLSWAASGSSAPTIFGSRATPRSVVAATGITSGAAHMSTSAITQHIYVEGSITGDSVAATITAGTVDGQTMTLIGRNTAKTVTISATGTTNIYVNGNCTLGLNATLVLRWDTSEWVEVTRSE